MLVHCIPTMPSCAVDPYIVTVPERVGAALDSTTGIASNLGKARVCAAEAGFPPPGIFELDELAVAVWRSNKPPVGRGSVVFGTPTSFASGRRNACWRNTGSCAHLPSPPDSYCRWLFFSTCVTLGRIMRFARCSRPIRQGSQNA